MAVNLTQVINWFESRKGKLTYSMTGSRNGRDGTADCSGAITQAIRDSGGPAYDFLYSTVTLGGYLQRSGFTCISRNQNWESRTGDIIMISYGSSMASSGGAGGHVGILKNPTTFISVDYWTGGQRGTAVSEHNWETYYARNRPPYIEVWRLNNSTPASAPAPASARKSNDEIAKEVVAGKWGNGEDRTNRLRAAGYNPDEVQRVVNASMAQSRYYTVKAGENLSVIGQKLGVRWQTIAEMNNIRPPHIIHAGQRLRY